MRNPELTAYIKNVSDLKSDTHTHTQSFSGPLLWDTCSYIDTDSLNLALAVTTSFASYLSIRPVPQSILLSAIKVLVSYIFYRHRNSSETFVSSANFNFSISYTVHSKPICPLFWHVLPDISMHSVLRYFRFTSRPIPLSSRKRIVRLEREARIIVSHSRIIIRVLHCVWSAERCLFVCLFVCSFLRN